MAAAQAERDTVSLATITTDTGDFAPGNKEFSRFTAPGMCIGAVHVMRDVANRSFAREVQHLLRDTMVTGDTLPPVAGDVARRCMARFQVRTIPAATLPDLFTLALHADADSLARAVVARQLAAASDGATKTTVLQAAVDSYLQAEPARVAAAVATAAQIDALTVTADKKLVAHYAVLQYALSHWDVPTITAEAERLIAIGQQSPMADVRYAWEPILRAYAALGAVAYVEAPDSVMAVMARAKADLGRYPPANTWPDGISYSPIMLTQFKSITPAQVRNVLLPFNAQQYAGRPLPPVTAAYWFPKAPDRWPPGTGRVSLVVYGGWLMARCRQDDAGLLIYPTYQGIGCRALYTWLPQWTQRHGSQLDITLVSREEGEAVRSITLSPQAEADSVRWFYQEYLKLPVRVGFVRSALRELPGVDGRVQRRDTTALAVLFQQSKWSTRNYDGGVVILYDGRGALVYVGPDLDDPIFRQLLGREVRAVGATPETRGGKD